MNLFDDPSNVIDLDERISRFLTANTIGNILLFYTGHGGFLSDREYYLTIQSTRKRREHTTGLRIRALAETLSQFIADRNLFIILDCCFAGEAVKIFQSNELNAIVEAKTFDALPKAGTALLVASSKDEPAISPVGKKYTMFSEAFLNVLRDGIPGAPDNLTLHDIERATQEAIRSRHGLTGVRPEVHSPRQKGVDAAELAIFPNFADRVSTLLTAPEPNPVLTDELESCCFDNLRNVGIVGSDIITETYLETVSDILYDISKALAMVDRANSILRRADSGAVRISRGNLVLSSTSLAFWRSLFDEAGLQGHKTMAILACLVARRIPAEYKYKADNLVTQIEDDYRERHGGVDVSVAPSM
ncbi:hypothetical protein [Mesorhizobium sp. B1-1-8]|uniref:hypothetical protein n=1 Tax=Mesorhizobium sp. B1-1-8 TaxID=2589976 RepID=UPI00112C52A8|nr:hypothetical protein [Mesorhizobium sp. B1-1-8]UCI07381.1 hypothetical protein FJ974_26960 [Mesorhizobium sp. B1-1-8]